MTYRDRRAAKAERLRGWAAGREQKAAAELERANAKASVIPLGQPILVGHYSEGRDRRYRASISRGFDRAHEHATKAADMARRADGIDAAAERAIYSDDPDAVERLRERIVELETERARRKAANVAYRAAHRAELAAMSAYARGQAVPFPSYSLSNLSGRISTTRARLARMEGA